MEEARDPPNGAVEVSLPTHPRAFFASLYTTTLTLGTGYYKYETGPFCHRFFDISADNDARIGFLLRICPPLLSGGRWMTLAWISQIEQEEKAIETLNIAIMTTLALLTRRKQ